MAIPSPSGTEFDDLTGWYAQPLAPAEARALLDRAHAELQGVMRGGRDPFPARLRIVIARFWLDKPVALDHSAVLAAAPDDRRRAIIELIYGQLRLSRKLNGAMAHLDRGFNLAAPFLSTPQYVTLLRRHDSLRRLALGTVPQPPSGLEGLLREAGVIARLEATLPGKAPPFPGSAGDRNDTLG